MLKIHVPDVTPELMIGELKNIILAGIRQNTETELWHCPEEADYIFLDFRHLADMAYPVAHPQKTVIIDYQDNPHGVYPVDALLYFKRSVVDRAGGGFMAYRREVIPISYCVKDDYVGRRPSPDRERDIDVAVFFDPNESPATARNRYRSLVARCIRDEFPTLKVFAGIAGQRGEAGRSGFQAEYFDLMTRAKIVVTCNPDRWEGDNRLFEALSGGSLVLSDAMLTPVENPLLDWEHLIYYDKDNLQSLHDIIDALLPNERVRSHIANAGYEHAMQWHKPGDRIAEILKVLRAVDILGDGNSPQLP